MRGRARRGKALDGASPRSLRATGTGSCGSVVGSASRTQAASACPRPRTKRRRCTLICVSDARAQARVDRRRLVHHRDSMPPYPWRHNVGQDFAGGLRVRAHPHQTSRRCTLASAFDAQLSTSTVAASTSPRLGAAMRRGAAALDRTSQAASMRPRHTQTAIVAHASAFPTAYRQQTVAAWYITTTRCRRAP